MHQQSSMPTRINTTKTLLGGAVIAGPLFVGLAIAQMVARPDFDMERHPLSLLSLEDDFVYLGGFVPTLALLLVLVAAIAHSTWNFLGKRAAEAFRPQMEENLWGYGWLGSSRR